MRNSALLKWAQSMNNKTGKENKNWIHPPENLQRGHIVYIVKFMGSIAVDQPKGFNVVREAVQKLRINRKLTEGSKLPKVELTISVNGISIQETKTKAILHQYPLYLISYCADDKIERQFISFIVKEHDVEQHTCFVFISDKLSEQITMTIGQAFELAYKLDEKPKLSFRARHLDVTKPLPIYMAEDLPELMENMEIKRAVPQMPTGMEEDEECEHHLQRAMITGTVIPTPEVEMISDMTMYNKTYDSNYTPPRQLIRMPPIALVEEDYPDYDADSEDEQWLNEVRGKGLSITIDKFEEIIDKLDKNSNYCVITLQESKQLLSDCSDELVTSVYDYWLLKRLRLHHSLMLQVKTEPAAASSGAGGSAVGSVGGAGGGTGVGSFQNDPYVAFRKRKDKMQTRKNRKNDEYSYEKMRVLFGHFQTAYRLCQLVLQRERLKKAYVDVNYRIYKNRFQTNDHDGSRFDNALKKRSRNGEISYQLLLRQTNGNVLSNLLRYNNHYYRQQQQLMDEHSLDEDYDDRLLNGILDDFADDGKFSIENNNNKRKLSSSRSSYCRGSGGRNFRNSASTGGGGGDDKRSTTSAVKRKYKLTNNSNGTSIDDDNRRSSNVSSDDEKLPLAPLLPSSSVANTTSSSTIGGGAKVSNLSDEEGEFTFRRRKNCSYLAPNNYLHPANNSESYDARIDDFMMSTGGDQVLEKYRFHPVYISLPTRKYVGWCRRRLGRGGRILLDRLDVSSLQGSDDPRLKILLSSSTDDPYIPSNISDESSSDDHEYEGDNNSSSCEEDNSEVNLASGKVSHCLPLPLIELENDLNDSKMSFEITLNNNNNNNNSDSTNDALINTASDSVISMQQQSSSSFSVINENKGIDNNNLINASNNRLAANGFIFREPSSDEIDNDNISNETSSDDNDEYVVARINDRCSKCSIRHVHDEKVDHHRNHREDVVGSSLFKTTTTNGYLPNSLKKFFRKGGKVCSPLFLLNGMQQQQSASSGSITSNDYPFHRENVESILPAHSTTITTDTRQHQNL